ncbi:MAG: endonuclease III [Bdellovibrionales bacterium]
MKQAKGATSTKGKTRHLSLSDFNLRTKSGKKEHVQYVIRVLQRYYPEAHCALEYSNPFELLIATILSAQCTDDRVNIVTRTLFKKYQSVSDFAKADLEELENDIKSTGFYRNKAKNILACSQKILSEHKGHVPQTLEELVQLGGVGRKTANVVLGNAFGIASGVVVDTHVTRLSNRLGWVKGTDAVKIEKQLNELVDRKYWIMLPHYLISHGRAVCKARKPKCETCFLESLCPKRPYNK